MPTTLSEFAAALQTLEDQGTVKHLRRKDENAWLCNAVEGWSDTARRLSLLVGGMVFPRRDGLTWQYGAKTTAYVSKHKSWAKIKAARDVASKLDLPCGYSVPAVARAMVKWIGPPLRTESGSKVMLEGISLGYHDCKPGIYHYTVQHDVSSCYYHLLQRLPSLSLGVAGAELSWSKTPADVWERWRFVLDLVKDCKPLRNTLWGTALGQVGHDPLTAYSKGATKLMQLPHGPFHAAALLVGRTAWELNRAASEETSAVYSQTDCVITEGLMPRAWQRFGLDTRIKHEGPSQICSRGIYCPNLEEPETATEWYRKGSRFEEPVALEAAPMTQYHSLWL